jgi:hypothetical protein
VLKKKDKKKRTLRDWADIAFETAATGIAIAVMAYAAGQQVARKVGLRRGSRRGRHLEMDQSTAANAPGG